MSFFRDIGRILLQEKESGQNVPTSDIIIHNLSSEEALAEAAGSNVELYALGVEIERGRLEATRLLPVAV